MSEFKRGGKTYLRTEDGPFEYDKFVKIYVDAESGNWVVDTNMDPDLVIEVLDETIEHFEDYGDGTVEKIEGEEGLPDILIFPLPGDGYH